MTTDPLFVEINELYRPNPGPYIEWNKRIVEVPTQRMTIADFGQIMDADYDAWLSDWAIVEAVNETAVWLINDSDENRIIFRFQEPPNSLKGLNFEFRFFLLNQEGEANTYSAFVNIVDNTNFDEEQYQNDTSIIGVYNE